MRQDVFELASFQKKEGTRFRFEDGKRELFNVEPDWVTNEYLQQVAMKMKYSTPGLYPVQDIKLY